MRRLYVLARQRTAEKIWNVASALYYYWPGDLDDDPEKTPWHEARITFQATEKEADDTFTRMVDAVCPDDHHHLAPCNFRVGSMRTLSTSEVDGDVPELLTVDFIKFADAVIDLYLQGLNGVICDPCQEELGRHNCKTCHTAWQTITRILSSYDEGWGNMYRPGGQFQPGGKAHVG